MSPHCPQFVMANHHLPHFLPNQALNAQFGTNEPYRLRFVNVYHHLPPFLPNQALGCSVWQKQAPPLTPLFQTHTRKMRPIWSCLLSLGSSLLLFYMFSTKPCIFQFNT